MKKATIQIRRGGIEITKRNGAQDEKEIKLKWRRTIAMRKRDGLLENSGA